MGTSTASRFGAGSTPRRAGEDLADAAVTACSESQPIDPTPMRILTQSVVMPLQHLPTRSACEALLEKQRNLLESSTNDDVAYWYARNNILCVQRLIELVNRSEQPDGIAFEVNALTLGGDFCLIALSDEVFCDYQLWIKENSPFKNTMVWAYTNGCEIYVPVDSAFQEGGYEAAPSPTLEYASALYYHNRLALAPGVERRIKDTVQGLWSRR